MTEISTYPHMQGEIVTSCLGDIVKVSVNAVAFQDEGLWIAQCLEHDIVVSAASLNGLRHALEKAIVSNLCVNMELGRSGLEGIPPAPEQFHDMFKRAGEQMNSLVTDDPTLPVEIAALRLAELESLGDC